MSKHGKKSPSPEESAGKTKEERKPTSGRASPPRPPPSGTRKHKNKKSSGIKTPPWLIKILGALFLPVIFGIFGYQIHQNLVVLPGLVNTPSDLPKVTPAETWTDPERFWGTYRANLYFGMRTRSPKSPLFGLMWYQQPGQAQILMPKIRHWCDQNDNLKSYGWKQHDGRSFGRQEIEDKELKLETSFVKRPGGVHGGDWAARITATPNEASYNDSLHSLIVYLALSAVDDDGSFLKPHIHGNPQQPALLHMDYLNGFTPDLGRFRVRFHVKSSKKHGVLAKNYLATRMENPESTVGHLKEVIISGTGVVKTDHSHRDHFLGCQGHVPVGAPPTDRPNFLALQVTFWSTAQTELEVVFESGSVANRDESLTGGELEQLLAERSESFERKLESVFGLKEKQYAEPYQEMAHTALSNMIGSIGYFHGFSRVISEYNRRPVLYGPLTLITTVPSRPFFPRGFLWDEGFHHLLLQKWDAELSLELLGSWLDLMNVEGWIPREVILGVEAEQKVPVEFVVQRNSIANPPIFFYLLGRYLEDKAFAAKHKAFFKKVYPRLRLWYQWLNRTQSGKEPGTYRWRGRNSTTDLELNPKTLPSGLDDYPRASHPTDDEYHLDLFCWMGVSSRTMLQLAEFVEDTPDQIREFQATEQFLTNPSLLEDRHWSEKQGRFCDYGLHTRHVQLERPKPKIGPDGRPRPPIRSEMIRQVIREPQNRLVSDTLGYISLFPLFLRLIPSDSPKLAKILSQMQDPDLLWSRFGLRSLAKTSPLYGARNTEHDPPYWRGSIWMNMNYLALSALHHYTQMEGPNRDLSFEVYGKLRGNVVANVMREFRKSGYLWEHYNDETGVGEGSHPFTGWTSLVLLIMSEQYD